MAPTWEPSALGRLKVDEVWKSLDRYGRYQVLQIVTLMFAGIPMAYPVLSVVLEGISNPHACRPHTSVLDKNNSAENSSVTSESCHVTVYFNHSDEKALKTSQCDGYQYERPVYVSFASEWDLVCSNAALVQVSQTLVMAGMAAGSFLLSNLADRYGRKRSHVGCHVALFAASLAMAFMPNYVSFAISKFFTGFFQQGYLIPLTTHLLELLPTEQRASMGVLATVLWSVSIVTMSPIAYALRHYSWRTLQIVYAAFHAFSLLELFILDESLRWLVANQRFESIRHVIRKAARYNRCDPEVVLASALAKSDEMEMKSFQDFQPEEDFVLLGPTSETDGADIDDVKFEVGVKNIIHGGKMQNGREDIETLTENRDEDKDKEVDEADDATKSRHHEGFLNLVKDSHMRFIALAMMYIWLTNNVTYYGVTLLSSSLAGDLYLNFFVGGLLEIPSCFVMWFGLSRMGRRKTAVSFISPAAVSLLSASVLAAFSGGSEAADVAQTVLTMAARFGMVGSSNVMWVYTPELFPTNLRNVGLGIACASARIGGMAAPFFNLLAEVAIWGPGVIFAGFCLLATFLLTQLPETSQRPLPQTISDIKAWRRAAKSEKQSDGVLSAGQPV